MGCGLWSPSFLLCCLLKCQLGFKISQLLVLAEWYEMEWEELSAPTPRVCLLLGFVKGVSIGRVLRVGLKFSESRCFIA